MCILNSSYCDDRISESSERPWTVQNEILITHREKLELKVFTKSIYTVYTFSITVYDANRSQVFAVVFFFVQNEKHEIFSSFFVVVANTLPSR